MSDLSNLLGDVYGDHSPDAAPVRREAPASDRGGEDLTATPSATRSTPAPLPVAPAPAVNLTDTAPQGAWAAPAVSMPAPAPVPVHAMAGSIAWSPGDDDIFPKARGKK